MTMRRIPTAMAPTAKTPRVPTAMAPMVTPLEDLDMVTTPRILMVLMATTAAPVTTGAPVATAPTSQVS